ncbi:cysteine dioxygenase family protein [Bordetella avium]|uniref:Cysteine dioxygenase n=1 Tax=Bordetella avium (strain 197N) TaxID=360910 RepID=Q2KVI2_BORA1|nr:cysteine dioxygenase family protein [Bordetella avium]AZY50228.1 cysteine dioxygenase [Bordetella avium]AZY53621.1 cysteine dioxygenase [Bordetella avium]RIQ11626.1 cysteine dioxygenase [Bordetella avium]RIQ16223.1 cysteine dioxygenase [Bordetella avium]RIQ30931.1 cysteine dioxygenase [Bordetella avium]
MILTDRASALGDLCRIVDSAAQKAAANLLSDLAAGVAATEGMLAYLPESLRAGEADSYTRHIAYADPHGRFTIAYLIWRQGQFSPVHGHKTWCTYQVLQGQLTETHFRWHDGHADRTGSKQRLPGDIVTAMPGLQQIHQLGNADPQTAISLHIYGVPQADLSCGVNILVDTEAR